MPIYQVEEYIANSIQSIINQTTNSFELILVNDGTKDRSIEIAQSLLKETKINYSVLTQINSGVASARNTGISASRGKWIICIDPDDTISPNFLKRLLDANVKYGAKVVCCNYQLVFLSDVLKTCFEKEEDIVLYKDDVINRFLKRQINIISPGILIKKELIEKSNLLYDESIKYSEDQHYIWRVLISCEKIAYIKDPIYNYLIRENSTMRYSNIEKIITGYNGFIKFQSEIKENKILKKYILPKWVLSTLNASLRMMDFNSFQKLALKLEYKRYAKKLLLFPDIPTLLLSILLLINIRLFYFSIKYLIICKKYLNSILK